MWSKFDVKGDLTMQEFIDWFAKNEELEITMITSGVSMLYT